MTQLRQGYVGQGAAENKAVFLSYASQDAETAKRICEALRAAGVEVWFDQSELVGGDAWDQKIRRQIGSCALLLPVISASTQARREGYFRLEWRLAVERMRHMDDDLPFLLPVLIDDTKDAEAFVPDRFREVQWTRLPGGETPPAFAARVKRLLENSDLVGGASRPDLSAPSGHRAPPTKNRGPSKWWWALPMFGVAMALLLILKESREHAPEKPAANAPASEARQLAEKAQALIDKPGAARTELEAAEGLCKKAAKLDPTDAEVLATWSQVCSWLVFHGFDASPERKEAARSKAAQALQLAPESYDARFAQACYLVRGGGIAAIVSEGAQADELLQALLREQPDEPRALLALGIRQGRTGHIVEARVTLGQLAKNPAYAAMAGGELGWLEMFTANHAAAEVIVDRAIELQPLWRNLILKTLLAVEWRGDLDLALATQKRLPESVQQEDLGVFIATYLGYLRHEPERVLRLLDAMPRPWFDSGGYIGPKAVWAALAHEQLGARDRAEAQWRLALKSIEQRLAGEEEPDRSLQLLEAYVLAALDRKAEAERMLGLVRNASVPEPLPWLRRNRYVITELRLGHFDAALEYLESDPRLTAAVLRYEPAFEALRALPRFQALQARIEADPSRSPKAGAAALADEKSVAVLAFANLSDDKANEYFSDGISEELLNVLAKVPGLKVTARTSSFHFKGKDTAIREIAQQLGVAYVVEGSVRKAGDKVRITAQLIKAADGFHLWSDTFTRDMKDVFAVQDEIAGLIALNLSLKMGTALPSRPVDPEAYRLYLEALPAISLRTRTGFGQAEQLIAQAIARDPGLVQAQAVLAVVWGLQAQDQERIFPYDNPLTKRIVAQAEKAVQLGPDSAEAQAACGYIYSLTFQLAKGEQFLRRAIELNPSYAPAHLWLGRALLGQARIDEALAALKHATELDPLSHRALDNYAFTLVDAGRPQEALGFLEQALRIQPGSVQALAVKASALADADRLPEALALADQLPADLSGNLEYKINVYARAKRRAELAALLAPSSPSITGLERVYLLIALGRNEEALAALPQVTVDWGAADSFLFNPMLDPLRTDPRFVAALQARGLSETHARAQAWRAAHPPQKREVKL